MSDRMRHLLSTALRVSPSWTLVVPRVRAEDAIGAGKVRVTEELDAAKRYRLHAEELRVIAADKHALEIRKTLLGLATDYDALAASMEVIDRTNRRLRARG